MRSILYTTQHFPHYLFSDSYINFPFGFDISWPPLYDILASLAALIVGFGNPKYSTIEVVAANFSVVLGTLSLILCILQLPNFWPEGRFLQYPSSGNNSNSSYGFDVRATDHHVAEILISTAAFGLFIYSFNDSAYSDNLKKLTKQELIDCIRSLQHYMLLVPVLCLLFR
jgi:dolichyl-diphosphooligosaccharide--protein glycosyltransferase